MFASTDRLAKLPRLRNDDLFRALVASMWIGIRIRLLTVPCKWLFPSIVLLCTIGVHCLSNSAFAVLLRACFIFFGYAARRLRFEGAPLMLGFILGGDMEEYLRRSLTLSGGRRGRGIDSLDILSP
ncbi:tripartite tricarboxylate transporter permease [Pigmentiphaga sp.]|uniref:tripartite tricarboxylate transporter permease n=1 Tax=Pigmentiphaga sp. TaxID=1977564 RepID=UPI0025FDD330|nr:tripartite tricarboxylate transporter permease [Pigmentiphaga sp.]